MKTKPKSNTKPKPLLIAKGGSATRHLKIDEKAAAQLVYCAQALEVLAGRPISEPVLIRLAIDELTSWLSSEIHSVRMTGRIDRSESVGLMSRLKEMAEGRRCAAVVPTDMAQQSLFELPTFGELLSGIIRKVTVVEEAVLRQTERQRFEASKTKSAADAATLSALSAFASESDNG